MFENIGKRFDVIVNYLHKSGDIELRAEYFKEYDNVKTEFPFENDRRALAYNQLAEKWELKLGL